MPVTDEQLNNVGVDLDNIAEVANGDPHVVTMREGREVPTVSMAVMQIAAPYYSLFSSLPVLTSGTAGYYQVLPEDTGTHPSVPGDVGGDGANSPNSGIFHGVVGVGYIRLGASQAGRAEAAAVGAANSEAAVNAALTNLGLIQTEEGVSIFDEAGNIVWKIGESGIMENVEYQQTQSNALLGGAVAESINPQSPIKGSIIYDDNGAVVFVVDEDGKVNNKYIDNINYGASLSLGMAKQLRDPAQRAYAIMSKLAHIILYGQSLSIGTATSKLLLNYADLPWAKMYQGGLRERNAYATAYKDDTGTTVPVTTYNSSFRNSFVTAKEATETDGTAYGETGLMAAMEMVAQLLLDEDGIDIASIGQQFLLSTCGEGATRIANLKQGSQNYQRIIDSAAAAQALAATAGITPYGAAALLYHQLERDIAIDTLTSSYTADFRSILTSLRATFAATTGIDKAIPCIAYQTDGHRHYGKDAKLTSEVYDWICAQSDVALSCPIYMFPSVDNIHRDHLGYARIGAYDGIALKRWLFDQVKPRHLQPGTPIWTPNAIVLPFDVPSGKLTIDTTTISDPGFYGISIVDPDLTTTRNVTAVEPLGTDRIIVRYSGATLATGSQLRLGWGDNAHPTGGPTTGSRTCFRDQQGDKISYRGYPMHNNAPICARTRN